MTTTLSTRQLSASAAVLEWATDTPPASWEVEREGPGIFTTLAVVEAAARLYVDDTLDDSGLVAGDVVTYRLVDPSGPTVIVTATPLTLADAGAPFTYGPSINSPQLSGTRPWTTSSWRSGSPTRPSTRR